MFASRCYCTIALLLLLGASVGCYDSGSLIDEVRNQAIRTRLDEVHIGYFRTTLPRAAMDDSPMEVELDMFGTAVRHRIPDVEAAIKQDSYRLRQAVMIAIRQTTAAEISDPDLITFRERLLQVVNSELGDNHVETVGLRTVRFIPL